MKQRRLVVLIMGLALLACPLTAFAQTERGTITGVVMDSTKAAVPGVSVRVINTATNVATNVV